MDLLVGAVGRGRGEGAARGWVFVGERQTMMTNGCFLLIIPLAKRKI